MGDARDGAGAAGPGRELQAGLRRAQAGALPTSGGWGATGQLSGIWLGLWASASGGAAQSASMFIRNTRKFGVRGIVSDEREYDCKESF